MLQELLTEYQLFTVITLIAGYALIYCGGKKAPVEEPPPPKNAPPVATQARRPLPKMKVSMKVRKPVKIKKLTDKDYEDIAKLMHQESASHDLKPEDATQKMPITPIDPTATPPKKPVKQHDESETDDGA